MSNFIKRRAHRALVNHIRTRYDRIHPEPFHGYFNYQCHKNSVNYALAHPDLGFEVVELIYIDKGEPILHYVVHDSIGKRYLEMTLGHLVKNHTEFYKIRTIDPSDYHIIDDEFERSMKGWKDQFVHPLLRWAVDRVV